MDFFGTAFNIIGKKLLSQGLKSAFGGKERPKSQPVMPSFAGLSMDTAETSGARETAEIETSDYDVIKAMWDKRLFGDKSYTNITITPSN
tara:strand:- start:136 stop:405 length:270 start_codon:yes stop_codon:yes gene_type:complete